MNSGSGFAGRAGHNIGESRENNRNRNHARPVPNHSSQVAPRTYEVAEQYRKRREWKLKQITEEEERLRQHHARPMPNFKAIHAATAVTTTVQQCTSPDTPEVSRRGLAMKEKQRQKIKQLELKLAERPTIVVRSTKVLLEEPFKPKLDAHRPLRTQPFNLHMLERLAQRKEFDRQYQQELAAKKEKENELKRLQEMKMMQAAREKTAFKAKPNPFKKPQRSNTVE